MVIHSDFIRKNFLNPNFNSPGILSVPVKTYNSLSKGSKIRVFEGAAGNLPDENAQEAAIEITKKVSNLTNDDVLIVLITGGGSALLPLPLKPITLDEKSTLVKQLSRAGATINELNTVRIAISRVKGGKLAAIGKNAHKIVSLIVSDIIDDPLDLIASGPTIDYQKPEVSPREILQKYNLLNTLPASIAKLIQENEASREEIPEPIKNSDVFLIGNNRIAIEAAMEKAKSFNLFPVFLSASVQGDVVDVSEAFFELAFAINTFPSSSNDEFVEKIARITGKLSAQSNFVNDLVAALEAESDGICIISGGETTVTVLGDGLGGRNQELALRFTQLCFGASTASSLDDLLLLSAGTDGVDGNNDAAGSLGGSRILSDLIDGGNVDVKHVMQDFINRNDSYSFYRNVLRSYAGDRDRYQLFIGHTGTNVMDLHLLMIMPKPRLT